MNAATVAAERRLEACLGEVHGDAMPDDLVQRTLRRLQGVAAPRSRGGLLAAMVLLGGIAVVAAVAWLQPRESRTAQDPDPTAKSIVITTADLPPEPRVDLVAGADVVGEMLRIGKQVAVPVVVAGDVVGKVKTAKQALPWRQAMAMLAATAGAGIEELGPVLIVRQAKSLPYDQRLSLVAEDLQVGAFAKVLAAKVGVDLVIDGRVRGRIRCDFQAVSWRDALDAVASQLGCSVIGCGSVLVLRPQQAVTPPRRTSFAFRDKAVTEVFDVVAKMTASNILVAPGSWGTVSLQVLNLDVGVLLPALARAAGGRYRFERQIHMLMMAEATALPPVDVTAEHVDLRTFAELARSSTAIEIGVPDDAVARLTVFARHASFADLVAAAALATGREVVVDPKDPGKLRIQ